MWPDRLEVYEISSSSRSLHFRLPRFFFLGFFGFCLFFDCEIIIWGCLISTYFSHFPPFQNSHLLSCAFPSLLTYPHHLLYSQGFPTSILMHFSQSSGEKKATRVSPFLAWGDFHARSRFARSTSPEEKWGTTRSLVKSVLQQTFF